MMGKIKRLLGWKYIGQINHTIYWTDAGSYNYVTYLLYEHPWFGRSYKAVGFQFSHMEKESKTFTRRVAPWLNGAQLPQGTIT